LLIPYDRGDIVATVHREGEVLSAANEDNAMRVRARLADASAGRLSEFVVRK
jgi:GTP-binding protein HflX